MKARTKAKAAEVKQPALTLTDEAAAQIVEILLSGEHVEAADCAHIGCFKEQRIIVSWANGSGKLEYCCRCLKHVACRGDYTYTDVRTGRSWTGDSHGDGAITLKQLDINQYSESTEDR